MDLRQDLPRAHFRNLTDKALNDEVFWHARTDYIKGPHDHYRITTRMSRQSHIGLGKFADAVMVIRAGRKIFTNGEIFLCDIPIFRRCPYKQYGTVAATDSFQRPEESDRILGIHPVKESGVECVGNPCKMENVIGFY